MGGRLAHFGGIESRLQNAVAEVPPLYGAPLMDATLNVLGERE